MTMMWINVATAPEAQMMSYARPTFEDHFGLRHQSCALGKRSLLARQCSAAPQILQTSNTSIASETQTPADPIVCTRHLVR